jgi:inactivated superfamily I helicase
MEKICHEAFLQMQETAEGMDPEKDGKAMVQQLLNLLQRRNADLQNVLTRDQLALYQEHKMERFAELITEILMMQFSLSESQTGQVHDVSADQWKAYEDCKDAIDELYGD